MAGGSIVSMILSSFLLFFALSANASVVPLGANQCCLDDYQANCLFLSNGTIKTPLVSPYLDALCERVGEVCVRTIMTYSNPGKPAALNYLKTKCGGLIKADVMNNKELSNAVYGTDAMSVTIMNRFGGFQKIASLKWFTAEQRSAVDDGLLSTGTCSLADLSASEIEEIHNGDFRWFGKAFYDSISDSAFEELLTRHFCLRIHYIGFLPGKFISKLDAICMSDILTTSNTPFGSTTIEDLLLLPDAAIKALTSAHTSLISKTDFYRFEVWCSKLNSLNQLHKSLYPAISPNCLSQFTAPFTAITDGGSLKDFSDNFYTGMTYDQCLSIDKSILNIGIASYFASKVMSGSVLCPVLLEFLDLNSFRFIGGFTDIAVADLLHLDLAMLDSLNSGDFANLTAPKFTAASSLGFCSRLKSADLLPSNLFALVDESCFSKFINPFIGKTSAQILGMPDAFLKSFTSAQSALVDDVTATTLINTGLCSKCRSLTQLSPFMLNLANASCVGAMKEPLKQATATQINLFFNLLNSSHSYRTLNYDAWVSLLSSNHCSNIEKLSYLDEFQLSSLSASCFANIQGTLKYDGMTAKKFSKLSVDCFELDIGPLKEIPPFLWKGVTHSQMNRLLTFTNKPYVESPCSVIYTEGMKNNLEADIFDSVKYICTVKSDAARVSFGSFIILPFAVLIAGLQF